MTLALSGTDFANAWEIWVYPPGSPEPPPAGLVVSRDWDDATKAALAAGKPVLIFPRTLSNTHSLAGTVLAGVLEPGLVPHAEAEHDGHPLRSPPPRAGTVSRPTSIRNWQWYELLDHSRSVILDDTPASFRPIVQVIDNFARNHKLGNLFEARVGSGRLLVCTIDLPGLAGSNPAARQLLRSLHAYAGSDAFRPAVELDSARLDSLLQLGQSDVMQKLGARVVQTDSQQPGFEAANILDGDPATIWHTTYGEKSDPFPHEVVIAPGPAVATGRHPAPASAGPVQRLDQGLSRRVRSRRQVMDTRRPGAPWTDRTGKRPSGSPPR